MKKIAQKPQKARMGRPKSAHPRRLYITGVRISEAELQQLRDSAASCRLTLSQWVRARLGLPPTGYGTEA